MNDNENHAPEGPQGSVVKAVRLQASAAAAFQKLVHLHFLLEHIPQETDSAYLLYLITADAEKQRDEILKRRNAVTR
ncbi:MAG: hypothetical protein ACLP9S_17035 [Syntrophales bacterium]